MPETVLISNAALDAIEERIDQRIKEALHKALEEHGLKKPKVAPGALDSKEAAAYLGISRTQLYETPALMRLSFRVGRRRLWRKVDLDAWMAEQNTVVP
jgi:excisionase family DNA binding protein